MRLGVLAILEQFIALGQDERSLSFRQCGVVGHVLECCACFVRFPRSHVGGKQRIPGPGILGSQFRCLAEDRFGFVMLCVEP